MPCQDKSTIQRKSSVLSVDVWRVLSPGGPIFNGVWSNGFSLAFFAFLCFVCFWGGEPADEERTDDLGPQPPQNGCVGCAGRELQRRDVSRHVIARGGEKKQLPWLAPFTTWRGWAYLSAWREIRSRENKRRKGNKRSVIDHLPVGVFNSCRFNLGFIRLIPLFSPAGGVFVSEALFGFSTVYSFICALLICFR